MRYLLLLILVIQLGGCALLEKSLKQKRLISGPTKTLIKEAKRLQSQQKWAEAEQYYKAALERHPKNEELQQAHTELMEDWNHWLRFYSDQIMVIEARELRNKLPLIEKLSQIDPNNLILKSRRAFWQQALSSKVPELVTCGEYHLKRNRQLARDCLLLASNIEPSTKAAELLAQIKRREAAIKSAKRTKQEVKKAQSKVDLSNQLITEGRAALEAGEYVLAIDRLNSAAQLQPGNSEVANLLATARSARDSRVDELLKIGDEMYRNEYIEQAVTAWEAASKLAPERGDIAQRIDRAGKVLERLDQIRRQREGS